MRFFMRAPTGLSRCLGRSFFAGATLAAALAFSARAEVDLSKLPPPSPKTGATYAADIRPIFEVSCFRCHGADRQRGRLRLDSLEAALKGGEDGRVIEPGDSAKSSLVIAVARLDPDEAMPPIRKGGPGGPPPSGNHPPARPLTADEVGLIRAWIDQGAK